jgi:hypothetical protein
VSHVGETGRDTSTPCWVFERVVTEVVRQSGRIDYLFNNAGIGVGVRSTRTRSMTGTTFSVLCPGAIRTPILSGGEYGRFKGVSGEQLLKFWEPMRPMAPEKFAERALRGVFREDLIIVVPACGRHCGTSNASPRPYRCGPQGSRSSACAPWNPPPPADLAKRRDRAPSTFDE